MNESYNETCDAYLPGPVPYLHFQILVHVLYPVIFIVSLLGNGLVCYVVYSSARMQTVTNFFIVNLAMGDLLMTVFCVPFSTIYILVLGFWPFGIIMCRAVSFCQAVSVFVSAYTLVAISFDRYIAIMWPLKPRMSKRQAKVIILGVWTVASLIASPILFVTVLIQPEVAPWFIKCDKVICIENWEEYGSLYSGMLMVLQYGIPLLVLLTTYTSIAIVVWGKRPPGEAENSRDQRMAKSKKKVIKMMMLIVVVFTSCWLPFNIFSIVRYHIETLGDWFYAPYLWFALHWLAMSHTCYNSIIYCWMNSRFRAGFSNVLHIFRKKYRQNRGNHSTLQRINTSTTYVSTRGDAPASLKTIIADKNFKNKFPILEDEEEM
uniref:G-protein coupled receptors family 1 profile domain-containing protein n=1 Tax=Clastoptera arizonana TaxID=38151 RepID=A0A1B6DRF1_9HEMI